MEVQPDLPIAISLLGERFLIFDVDVVTYLRREHHICGVTGGTLPQNPSQNLFLGLPMQIMAEEAQLLIDKGVGYLFDDTCAHSEAQRNFDSARYADYMANVRRKAQQASKFQSGVKEEQKRAALSKKQGKKVKIVPPSDEEIDIVPPALADMADVIRNSMAQASLQDDRPFNAARLPLFDAGAGELEDKAELFDATGTSQSLRPSPTPHPYAMSQSQTLPVEELLSVTPTTSADFLPTPQYPITSTTRVPDLPPSYALYKHLNSKAYFMTPGLRFGCQYTVYPGDPLRFHSHFLSVGYKWDEEIDLMDIVGGGRLGTGVKKGWLIGGEQPADASGRGAKHENGDARVRTFSVEWAAM